MSEGTKYAAFIYRRREARETLYEGRKIESDPSYATREAARHMRIRLQLGSDSEAQRDVWSICCFPGGNFSQ